MASTERDVPVRLHVFGLERTAAVARVRERDRGERVARAARAAGLCVGLAALAVLLPIAHFVLVPGFLLAAPVLALLRLRERASIVALRGTCPRCREERTFEARGAFRSDFRVSCPVCSFAIEVEFAAVAPGGAAGETA
jgi:hypothetical protein